MNCCDEKSGILSLAVSEAFLRRDTRFCGKMDPYYVIEYDEDRVYKSVAHR
jgi:hypothetical protein